MTIHKLAGEQTFVSAVNADREHKIRKMDEQMGSDLLPILASGVH